MVCGALRPQQLLQLQLQQNHLMAIFVVRSISHLSVMIQSDTRRPGSGDLHSTFSSTIQNKLTQRRLSFDILTNIILFDKRKSSHHRLVNYFLFFPINFLICWLQCGSSNNGGSWYLDNPSHGDQGIVLSQLIIIIILSCPPLPIIIPAQVLCISELLSSVRQIFKLFTVFLLCDWEVK